jgi:hypothetical protein
MANARCKACNGELLWTTTATGKLMPLDVAVDKEGNVYVEDGCGYVLSDESLNAAREANRPLHKSHFATCPEADRFRRR